MNIAYIIINCILSCLISFFGISMLQHSYYSIRRVLYRYIDQIQLYWYLLTLAVVSSTILLPVCFFYPILLLLTLLVPIIYLIFIPKILPKITYRFCRLIITSFLINIALLLTFYYYLNSLLLLLSLTPILSPLILIVSFLILEPYEIHKRNHCYKDARKRLISIENLTIIGITGSYAKTTVKYFLYQMLGSLSVIKSPGNTNTPLGLANFIRKNLTPFDKILILEIGVDSLGGMNKFKKFLTLDYAVITNIGKQHLRTFKTLDNIIQEKSKISMLLKPQGTLFYNSDCYRISKYRNDINYVPCSKKDYSIIHKYPYGTLINLDGLVLDLPLTSKNAVFDAYIAYRIACKLTSLSRINTNIRYLTLPSRRDKIFIRGNLTIIDNSYNININGLKNSISQMKEYERPYYIITGGLPETGNNLVLLECFYHQLDNADHIHMTRRITAYEKRIIFSIPGLADKITYKASHYPSSGTVLLLTVGDNSTLR